jgi:hypothetical protein
MRRIHYRAAIPLLTLRGRAGKQDRLTPTTDSVSVSRRACAARRGKLFVIPRGCRTTTNVRRPSSVVHRTAAAHLKLARTRIARTARFWDGRCIAVVVRRHSLPCYHYAAVDRDLGIRPRWLIDVPYTRTNRPAPPPPHSASSLRSRTQPLVYPHNHTCP